MSGFSVIESDDYREEVADLMLDPIVIGMACSLVVHGQADCVNDSGFMTQALHHYNDQGGKRAHSIGGPSRAIKALIEDGRVIAAVIAERQS